MSAINKIPRGLRVLVVMLILAFLVWQFARDTVFYAGSIVVAILITLGVIFAFYRKIGVAAEQKSPGAGELKMEGSAENSETTDVETDNTLNEEDSTDAPAGQRQGKALAPRNVTRKPDGTDVAANYMRMAKNAKEPEGSITWKPVSQGTRSEDETPVIPEPVDEQSENQADEDTGEPPIPLIEDESELTEEEKNELENAVWYRCENPYCKFTRFLGVHHIVEEKDGGTNKLDNLIVLCPCCHDLAHRNEIPEEEIRNWISHREERFKFKPDWHHF